MSMMNEAIQRIKEALDAGESSSKNDWKIIFEECAGADCIETIRNVQKIIEKNFSFSLKEGVVPYAYFGFIDSDNKNGVYKVLADASKDGTNLYGYISNTQGGKILNDSGFSEELEEFANSVWNKYDFIESNSEDLYYSMYDGVTFSGKIKYKGKEVQAFNDFFSENYIKEITASNINTLFYGDAEKGLFSINCFGRTEFEAIMKSEHINTINGVNKHDFENIYNEAKIYLSDRDAMNFVCELMKAHEIDNLSNIYYINKGNVVEIVDKDTEGAISLAESLIQNRKISFLKVQEFWTKIKILCQQSRQIL